MDRPDVVLQDLRRQIEVWFPVIARGAHVTVRSEIVPKDGFVLIATFGNGEEKKKHYSVSYIQANQKKRTCDHAKDFLRELLLVRGVLS